MPPDRLTAVLHLHGKIAVQAPAHDGVVADGPVAIQTQPRQMDRQGVAGRGGLDIERSGFGIAAQNARHALLVGAARVHGGGVDGVSGSDGEHRFIRGRELAIERGRRKFVPLGRSGRALRNQGGRELVGSGMPRIVAIDKDDRPGNGAGPDGARQFLGTAVLVFGQKVDGISVERSFQFVSVKVAGQLVPRLAKFHREVEGRTVEIGDGEPSSRDGGLGQRKCRNQEQETQRFEHGDSL